MLIFEMLAERKIREAAERGELDDLPAQGAPTAPRKQRMRFLDRAKIESRYFGKVLRKLTR